MRSVGGTGARSGERLLQAVSTRDEQQARLGADLEAGGKVSVIIIAHNYAQVLDVCDRVNVLQHGRITFDKRREETSLEELTELVVAEYRASRAGRRAG